MQNADSWSETDRLNLELVEKHLARIRTYVGIFFWIWVAFFALGVVFAVLSTPVTFTTSGG